MKLLNIFCVTCDTTCNNINSLQKFLYNIYIRMSLISIRIIIYYIKICNIYCAYYALIPINNNTFRTELSRKSLFDRSYCFRGTHSIYDSCEPLGDTLHDNNVKITFDSCSLQLYSNNEFKQYTVVLD